MLPTPAWAWGGGEETMQLRRRKLHVGETGRKEERRECMYIHVHTVQHTCTHVHVCTCTCTHVCVHVCLVNCGEH